MTVPTIADLLAKTGVKTAAPVAAAPAAPAAPAKTAAPAAAAPAATAAPAAPAKTAAPAPRAAVEYDPAIFKTAEQQALLQQGIVIPDPATAKIVFDQNQKIAQAQKTAEQQAKVAEQHAIGVIQYHGQVKESAAMNVALATGPLTREDRLHVAKIAGMTGCSAADIYARASQLRKLAELEAAHSGESWVNEQAGRGARAEDGNMIQNAEGQRAQQEFISSASAGTRAPQPFGGPSDQGFQDTVTLPGNPGLNHGQKVDQGKAGPA